MSNNGMSDNDGKTFYSSNLHDVPSHLPLHGLQGIQCKDNACRFDYRFRMPVCPASACL